MAEARTPERYMPAYEDDGAALYDEWCRIVKHNDDEGVMPSPIAWAFLHPAVQAGWKVLAERTRTTAVPTPPNPKGTSA